MGQKVVLITGGSRGIGAACVRRFAADGCRVVINYRGSRGQAEALAAQVGGLALQADVASSAACQAMLQATRSRYKIWLTMC